MRYSDAHMTTILRRGAAFSALFSLVAMAAVVFASPARAEVPTAAASSVVAAIDSSGTALASAALPPSASSTSLSSGVLQARSGADFDPGYIISDELFYRSGDMSQAEIQSFLSAMIGSCSNSNCLNVKRTTTYTRDADRTVCKQYVGASNELTSAILYKVQEACGISAKVLLVTLQKEQGLVTHSAPSDSRLARAMGYGCPDNNGGVCDAEYYGLYNQLYNAAWQLKRYSTPTPWGYYQPGVKSIQYHPNASCGTKSVNIRNNATAALYNYTPYVPNSAALANLGGYGDACSSYGNRNFWDYYNAWFGTSNAATGDGEIAAAYAAAGGATGPLGSAGAAPKCGTLSACWQGFAHGVIHWTRTGGAVVVSGVEGDRFLALGGVNGVLGAPVSEVRDFDNPANGPGTAQIFARGYLYTSAAGSFSVRGDMNIGYGAEGWIRGPLGWPTAEQECVAEGCSQVFQHGTLYDSSSSSSAFGVFDPAIAAYFAISSASLGFPMLEARSFETVNGDGVVQAFASGYVYSSGSGVFTVPNAFGGVYAGAGWIRGALGWPVAEIACSGGACSQAFQHGVLYQAKPNGPVLVVSDPGIAPYYATRSSELGNPMLEARSFETVNGDGVVQAFASGYVYSSGSGVFTVPNAFGGVYAGAGWIRGALGWPVAEIACSGGACSQAFQHGVLYQAKPNGPVLVVSDPGIAPYYATRSSELGNPMLEARSFETVNGDGVVQAFASGYVYSSGSGVFTVPNAFGGVYAGAGWIRGALGWPVAEIACSGGACSQAFQHGVLYQASPGARVYAVGDASIAAYYALSSDVLGSPTLDARRFETVNGSGVVQAFEGGYVYSSVAGVFMVPSVNGGAYASAGWIRGSLGWPTAERVCSEGSCTQQFQFGSLAG